MTHYVNFGLPTHNKEFVTVALKDVCPPGMYEPLERAVQKYVSDLVACFLFGETSVQAVRADFLKDMDNCKVNGVELAKRCADDRDYRTAICHNVVHYDFRIIEGDEFERRTLMHAAYESVVLKAIADFVTQHRGEVVDRSMHERLLAHLQDTAHGLCENRFYRNRPTRIEIRRAETYDEREPEFGSFAQRRQIAMRMPLRVSVVGYTYHFHAPSHHFEIYVSADFRDLKMETCRAEGIDAWLPERIRPNLN